MSTCRPLSHSAKISGSHRLTELPLVSPCGLITKARVVPVSHTHEAVRTRSSRLAPKHLRHAPCRPLSNSPRLQHRVLFTSTPNTSTMRLSAILVAALTVALSASQAAAQPGRPGLGPQGRDSSRGSAPSVGDKNHTEGHKKHFRGSGSSDGDVDGHWPGLGPDGSWDGSGSAPGPHHHKKHHCGPPHPRFNGSFDGSFHGPHNGSFHGCDDGSNSTEASVQAVNSSSTASSPAPANAKQITLGAAVSVAMATVYVLV